MKPPNYDITDEVGLLITRNKLKNMQSNIFKLNWRDVVSAVVSSIIVAVLGVVANATDLATLNWHVLLGLAISTGATSLLKALTTTSEGKFLGAIPIK